LHEGLRGILEIRGFRRLRRNLLNRVVVTAGARARARARGCAGGSSWGLRSASGRGWGCPSVRRAGGSLLVVVIVIVIVIVVIVVIIVVVASTATVVEPPSHLEDSIVGARKEREETLGQVEISFARASRAF
jgi:hypothetical protein